MWRYYLAATAIVLGLALFFIAFPLRMPAPRVVTGTPSPGPRATLPIYPHPTGGALRGEAPWAFDALPSCFTPRWEWQPGSDRIEERVTGAAVAARGRGRAGAAIAVDAWTGQPLTRAQSGVPADAHAVAPLPRGTVLHSGDCTVTVATREVRIARGDDRLTVTGARLYVLTGSAGRLLVAAHDGPGIAEVGGYLLTPRV